MDDSLENIPREPRAESSTGRSHSHIRFAASCGRVLVLDIDLTWLGVAPNRLNAIACDSDVVSLNEHHAVTYPATAPATAQT